MGYPSLVKAGNRIWDSFLSFADLNKNLFVLQLVGWRTLEVAPCSVLSLLEAPSAGAAFVAVPCTTATGQRTLQPCWVALCFDP